ncbi:unnamed protein product [Mycena citricolor]|uniref:Uncharacterized protein n=1 Tax=Mycena citricolor TaxID=2018698 RepID=A0AAD2HCQ4_9AGAR|nr:unnamed protein product [Mycena citricolor]
MISAPSPRSEPSDLFELAPISLDASEPVLSAETESIVDARMKEGVDRGVRMGLGTDTIRFSAG